jgi:hypothetical protein
MDVGVALNDSGPVYWFGPEAEKYVGLVSAALAVTGQSTSGPPRRAACAFLGKG